MSNTTRQIPRYVLGDSAEERERLRMQAALVEPFTERLFRAAGIDAGMRVLDLGCGMGDVSFLAARLVGPSGSVTGVDRNAAILAEARRRNEHPNVEFVQSELNEFVHRERFDAVVGRYILVYQVDPVATLRRAVELLAPGGVIAFHEADLTGERRSCPESPLWNQCMSWIEETFRRGGSHGDMGLKLPLHFHEAALPAPNMLVDVMMGGGPDTLIYAWAVSIIRSLLPRAQSSTPDNLQNDFSRPEQRLKAFLLEVAIVRQNRRQPFSAHGLHGDAIGKAITLIGSHPVELSPLRNEARVWGTTRTSSAARMS